MIKLSENIKQLPNIDIYLIQKYHNIKIDSIFIKTYDLIIEQTFFCALQPNLREKYVSKMYDLLSEKGKISGLFFNFPLTEVGPPFGGSYEEYVNLFSEKFTIKTLEPAYNSIKLRTNKELFFTFEKK